jgi:aquaporin Z
LFVQGWALQQLWLFIVAPLVGAVIAALAYAAIRLPDVVISTPVGERALASEQSQRQSAR